MGRNLIGVNTLGVSPGLFSDFVSDLEGGMEFTFNKFAVYTTIKKQREILGNLSFRGT